MEEDFWFTLIRSFGFISRKGWISRHSALWRFLCYQYF